MDLKFDKKNQAIEYLSIESVSIATVSQLTTIFHDGEKILKGFKSEINNNKHTLSTREKLDYLTSLKNEFWEYYNDESYLKMGIKSAEYNLMVYFKDMAKYAEKWTLEEYKLIYENFASTLVEKAKQSLRILFKSVKIQPLRRIGELPYTRTPREQIKKLLKVIIDQGYGEYFHWAVYHLDNPLDAKHPAVRWFFHRFLVLNADEYQTQFLWYITGFLLAEINDLQNQERGIDYYFKYPPDQVEILRILKDKGVLNERQEWVGIELLNPKKRVYELLKDKTAVVILIKVLDDKDYLVNFNGEITPVGRAFCNSFKIKLSGRGIREYQKLKRSAESYRYFDEIIPERKDLGRRK